MCGFRKSGIRFVPRWLKQAIREMFDPSDFEMGQIVG